MGCEWNRRKENVLVRSAEPYPTQIKCKASARKLTLAIGCEVLTNSNPQTLHEPFGHRIDRA